MIWSYSALVHGRLRDTSRLHTSWSPSNPVPTGLEASKMSTLHHYRGLNPAADLRFFIGKQPSKRARQRDVQLVPPGRGPHPPGGL